MRRIPSSQFYIEGHFRMDSWQPSNNIVLYCYWWCGCVLFSSFCLQNVALVLARRLLLSICPRWACCHWVGPLRIRLVGLSCWPLGLWIFGRLLSHCWRCIRGSTSRWRRNCSEPVTIFWGRVSPVCIGRSASPRTRTHIFDPAALIPDCTHRGQIC